MERYKILIIEDEPVHLNVMKTKLAYEGYDIIVATDGEDGLKKIKREKPNLVLLDIILPGLNGFEVLERLKEDGVSVPVIVVSNSGQPVEVDRALKLGARDYLVKAEFNPADVLEKVEKVLGKAPKGDGFDNPAGAKSPAGDLTASREKAPKLLIIEDDKFLRDLIAQKLRREGFDTVEAIDGESSLKSVREQRPDLILLDLILPGMDGFDVLKQLKADTGLATIPVIVLSNLGQKEDMDRALSGGAEDFMIKAHFTPGEIVTKIKSVLKKKYF